MQKVCFASIDIEPDFGKRGFQGVENLDKLLKLFQEAGVSLTLFVSGEVLEKYPDKAKEWAKDFEIASHSFSHRFWSELSKEQREEELDRFNEVYQRIFNRPAKGFRVPSHLIDTEGLKLIEAKGFLYDSSVLPHYPWLKHIFKPYRGFQGKAPLKPYFPGQQDCRKKGAGDRMKILEIPNTGQLFGIPLAGTWISKLPFFIYRILFLFHCPAFLSLSFHSWDSLNPKLLKKTAKILALLKKKNYQFLTGEQIHEQSPEN